LNTFSLAPPAVAAIARFFGAALFGFIRTIVRMITQVFLPYLVLFGLLWMLLLGTPFNLFSMFLLGLAFLAYTINFAFERYAAKTGK